MAHHETIRSRTVVLAETAAIDAVSALELARSPDAVKSAKLMQLLADAAMQALEALRLNSQAWAARELDPRNVMNLSRESTTMAVDVVNSLSSAVRAAQDTAYLADHPDAADYPCAYAQACAKKAAEVAVATHQMSVTMGHISASNWFRHPMPWVKLMADCATAMRRSVQWANDAAAAGRELANQTANSLQARRLDASACPWAVIDYPSYPVNPARYQRPNPGMPEMQPRSLHDAVADWHVPHLRSDQSRLWRRFKDEPGAQEFSKFLDLLQDTVSCDHKELRQLLTATVVKLLNRMSAKDGATIREICFAQSVSAQENCEDRRTQVFNRMVRAVMAHDLEALTSVPELLAGVRRQFRLEALERHAVQLAKQRGRQSEELTFNLGLQILLTEHLDLRLGAHAMRFLGAIEFSREDAVHAAAEVETLEREGFTRYLVNESDQWQKAFKKRDPEAYQEMMEAMEAAFDDSDEQSLYNQSLNARLTATHGSGLEGDARVQVGPEVKAQVTWSVQETFVRKFLRKLGLEPDQLLQSHTLLARGDGLDVGEKTPG